jgi:hypothetical protein
VVSTAAIKTHQWVLGSPTCSFVIVALRFYYTCAFCIANACCFSLRLLAWSLKAKAHCSSLGEDAANATGMENIDKAAVVAELERAFGENPVTFDSEAKDTLSEGVSDNANSKTYYTSGRRPSL